MLLFCLESLHIQCCGKTFLLHSSFLTEPIASPANVTANVLNSTSILVSWGQVPLLDQNGVILSSQFLLQRQTGLNEHTEYSITVFASTSKGGGTKSAPIVIITDEDSKFVIAVFFL